MNKNNNKSKTTNRNIKQLRNEISSLRKRLSNNAPVAISTKSGNQGKDYYHTKGMERISDVSALTTAYAVTGVFLNAANQDLFPWLSGIARKYDLYRFKKLIFRYKPSLPTSEAGNVYLGIDYNTLDPAPPTSSDFCQLSHWNTNVVWKPQSLQAKVPSTDWFYTRSGSVPNADYKTYDIGKFFVAVENISYTGTVGYLEVEYEVEFARRQPDYVSTQPPVGDLLYTVGEVASATSTSNGGSVKWSTSYIYDNSQGDVTLVDSNQSIFIDRPGYYEITITNSSGSLFTLKNGTSMIAKLGSYGSYSIYLYISTSATISVVNNSGSSVSTDFPGYFAIKQIA